MKRELAVKAYLTKGGEVICCACNQLRYNSFECCFQGNFKRGTYTCGCGGGNSDSKLCVTTYSREFNNKEHVPLTREQICEVVECKKQCRGCPVLL